MSASLVFISGASSGIGLALARSVPFENARVIDISRRGAPGFEHVAADLADPLSWPSVEELFVKEMAAFEGERVVFIHAAGTIEPIGFAGTVDPGEYARAVLLDAAAPLVLGAAFLRAAGETRADCTLMMISSGAAHSPYEGWTAYCAGKAAMDQWVRAAGAEQARSANGCRVIAVAPGIVETAMQERIRETSPREFPDVARFQALQRQGQLRAPEEVARDLWALLDQKLENGAVLDLRES